MCFWRDQWRVQRTATCALTRGRGGRRSLKLRGSSCGLRVLTRELARDVSATCWRPVVAEHISGVAHYWAGRLGMRMQPGDESVWSLPLELELQCGVGHVSRAGVRKGCSRSACGVLQNQSNDFLVCCRPALSGFTRAR